MLEKASAAKTIFEEHGIDTPAKKLAFKLEWVNKKKSKNKNLDTAEVNLLEVCQKIGRKPKTIGLWLKLISVDLEIQTIELPPQIEERHKRK